MLKKIVIICIILVTSPWLMAVDSVWDGGGADGLWGTAANWATDVIPSAGNRILIQQEATVTYNVTSLSVNKMILGVSTTTTPGACLVLPAGTLTNSSYLMVGQGSGIMGTVNITGATVTVRDLDIGASGGAGYANISAGLLTVTGSGTGVGLAVPFDASGYGEMHISGTGKVAATQLTMYDYGMIDVSGNGILQITGDKRTQIDSLISTGNITAESGSVTPTVLYEGGNTLVVSPDNTTYIVKARGPYPASGSYIWKPEVTLAWVPGTMATKHNVYFGTSSDNLQLVGSQIDANSFALTYGTYLNFGTKYYWRVDEVSDSSIYTGDVWDFTTRGLLYIDEFETYDSNGFNAAWTATGGATIAMDTTIYQGSTSMKLVYNNAVAPFYSEATSTNIWYNNFSAFDLKALDIWYYGTASNSAARMYAILSDGTNSATVQNSENMTQDSSWQQWNIALTDFTAVNPSLNLANITSLKVGVGIKAAPVAGGSGTIYIDNIRLYQRRCVNNPVGDLNNDCQVDFKDMAIMAAGWLGTGMFP